MKAIRAVMILSVMICLVFGTVWAANLNKPKNTVNNIRQADPPKVSTTTKPGPVGQPIKEYKPPAKKSLKIKEPPPPAKPTKK